MTYKSQFAYTKLRKTFGRQPLFRDVPAHMLDSIYPDTNDGKQYVLRNPVHRSVQAVRPQSEHEANTRQLKTRDTGVEHSEGGWPRDVHLYNEEHVARHRRRVLHEDGYIRAVRNLAPALTHYLDQNNAVEMYEAYFDGLPVRDPVENYSVRTANVFRDELARPVSCVRWTHESNSKVVASYSRRQREPGADVATQCLVWDVSCQADPLHTFVPSCSCWQLACSPTNPDVIVCGLGDGTVSVFDIKSGPKCVESSSIYSSHGGPVTALLYCNSRLGTEFFTGSLDGRCLWWDVRNLSAPTESLVMSVKKFLTEPSLSNAEGVSSLEFDPLLATKFLCGTESGSVLNINKMGREYSEKMVSHWRAHTSPVRAVHRSSCTSRMFLTCGDGTVRVWSEEVRAEPIMVNKLQRYDITDAIWAPLRYSSYMSVCAGGYFYYWDMLRRHDQPVVTLRVGKAPLARISPHAEGHSVIIGDEEGYLHLLRLSDTLVEPGARDKQLMFQMYERQTRREHILDSRLKEIRLKLNSEKEAPAVAEEGHPADEEMILEAEQEYFRTVGEELGHVRGLTPSETALL